jgi:hypothetical protein
LCIAARAFSELCAAQQRSEQFRTPSPPHHGVAAKAAAAAITSTSARAQQTYRERGSRLGGGLRELRRSKPCVRDYDGSERERGQQTR